MISRMWCPNKRATPTCVRCGGNPGILQEGSRGRSLECRPSTSHVDSLPLPSPDRLRAAGHCPRAGTEAQRGRTPRTLPRPGAGRRAEVTRAPKEMANRKCPYCNSPSPNPPASHAPGRRPQEPRERAGVATPHPGPAPEVHASRARRFLGTTSRGPAIPLGPDRDSTPRASRSDGSPSSDVARALGALRATPRS